MLFLLTHTTFEINPHACRSPVVQNCAAFVTLGMTKVEEKLKAGRVKRPEGSSEEHQKKHAGTPSHPTKKDLTTTNSSEYQFLICGLLKHYYKAYNEAVRHLFVIHKLL